MFVDKNFYLLMLLKRLWMMYVKSFLSLSLVISYEDFQFQFCPRMLLFFLLFLLNVSLLSCFNFVKSEKMVMHGDLTFLLNVTLMEELTRTQDNEHLLE